MRYGLTRHVLASSAFAEISEDEHSALVNAAHDLIHVLSIEEQFDLLIENYLDLETDLLRTAARSMVERNFDYRAMQIQRNLVVNRRLLNVLTDCRGYIDHTRHHLSHLNKVSTPLFLNLFDQDRSQQYDTSLGFRVMELLRNYTQHRAFPLSVTYHNAWVGDAPIDRRSMRVTVTPYLELGRLDKKKFKQSVWDELEAIGTKIDIKSLLREYIGSLGVVHERLRDRLSTYVQSCDDRISSAIQRFTSEFPDERPVGLFAVARDDDGVETSETYVFDMPTEYRRFLERKNSNLKTLARRYVTSEAV